MDKEHKSRLFPGLGLAMGQLCGSVACLDSAMTGFGVRRGCTVPAFLGSSPWTSALPTPTRSSLVRAGLALQAEVGAAGKVHAPVRGPGDKSTSFSRGTWKGLTPFWISCGSFPGGADKNVVVFDKSSEQILATLKGHTKKVTSVVFHPSQVRGSPGHPESLIPEPCFSGVGSQNPPSSPALSLVE